MSAAVANPVEVEQINAGIEICHGCGTPFRRKGQLWSCLKCGRVRVWGYLWPADRTMQPLLNCECCEQPMRHGYIGIAGRNV